MPPPLLYSSSLSSASSCAKQFCKTVQSSRSFSSTPRRDQRTTRARRALYRWLGTQGEIFRNPAATSTNYLGAYNAQGQMKRMIDAEAKKQRGQKDDEERKATPGDTTEKKNQESEDEKIPPETNRDLTPFPKNPSFVSQKVLSEEFRQEIWLRIMKEGKSVREVSAELSVTMERVGAVVRLMEIEKEWERIGKPLAKPYARAVMSMLPKTPWDPEEKKRKPHESIYDLPVHAATGQQIFYPTSESRHFTRVDAAKVFDKKLLPADERVPHPELAIMHRELKAGIPREERIARQQARDEQDGNRRQAIAAKIAAKEAAIRKVDTGRWEFRISDVNVDDIGKDGRGHKGTGWRYGVPLMDRSRGRVKIPTRVE